MPKNAFCFLLIFLIFSSRIKKINTDENISKLIINEISSGKIDTENTSDFYELSIPEILPDNELLIFTVNEDKLDINKDKELLFSDPDIYISKISFPKKREESDWYSEKYGNDIISIPTKELIGLNKLYISLFCEHKCKYNIKSYFTKELPLKLGIINSIKLSKDTSIHYFLKISQENFTQLKIVAYSPSKTHFHFLMSKDTKELSTQNSIKAIPFYFGGYMINIERTSKDYCNDCIYHILFQTEDDSTQIKFYAFFQDTFTLIESGQTLVDSLSKDFNRCYYYDLKQNFYLKYLNDDRIII